MIIYTQGENKSWKIKRDNPCLFGETKLVIHYMKCRSGEPGLSNKSYINTVLTYGKADLGKVVR